MAKVFFKGVIREELIIGVTPDELAPQDNATRAEIVMLLQRVCKKYAVLDEDEPELVKED